MILAPLRGAGDVRIAYRWLRCACHRLPSDAPPARLCCTRHMGAARFFHSLCVAGAKRRTAKDPSAGCARNRKKERRPLFE